MSINETNIIFVGGVHGVGKTTFCNKLSKETRLNHYSCSDLIYKFKEFDLKNKLTKNISTNQNILKSSINKYLSKETNYILDGHFCLIDENHNICRIPEKTFLELPISKIIILTNAPDIICSNLEKRDGKGYSIELINRFQTEEIAYANYISNLLKIDIDIIDYKNFY